MVEKTTLLGTDFFGGKIDDGGRDTNLVYFDGRTPAWPEHIEAASKRWLRARHTDFDELDGRYVDRSSKTVYSRAGGQPLLADGPGDVSVFFVQPDDGDGGQIVFLEKAGATLHELERETARVEAERARDEAALAEVRQKQLDRQPKRQVTLGDLEGRDLPTVQQAARIILEEYRGRIEASGGRIVISVPEMLTAPGAWDAGTNEAMERRRVADAARVLVAARDVVLQELDRRGPLDPDRLPDQQVAADGGRRVSLGLERLHREWEAVPLSLRATFAHNHAEAVRLRARVQELEDQLAHERQRVAFERRLTRYISRPREPRALSTAGRP